jgi:hypothetical protein
MPILIPTQVVEGRMSLNEDYDFANAEEHVRRAFLGTPTRTELRQGTQLYRFTNGPLSSTPADAVSGWWLPIITMPTAAGMVVDGFRVNEQRATRLNLSHREYLRARAAISEKFDNTMKHLMLVALKASMWAFVGLSAGQRQFKDQRDLRHVYLIGGATQIWIPRLHVRDLQMLGESASE